MTLLRTHPASIAADHVVAVDLETTLVDRIAERLEAPIDELSIDDPHLEHRLRVAAVFCLPSSRRDHIARLRGTGNGSLCVEIVDDESATPFGELACTAEEAAGVMPIALDLSRARRRTRDLERRLDAELVRTLPGDDSVSRVLRREVTEHATVSAPLVVSGEPGSDLSTVGWALHRRGDRWENPFVPVDCRFLVADDVVETWTNATSRAAPGGTLFVDHLEDVSAATRSELSRCLQNTVRLNAASPTPIRIVVGLRTDSESEARAFCESTGLDTGHLRVPGLRHRLGAVAAVSESIVADESRRLSQPPRPLSGTARRLLQEHEWTGNEAELHQVLGRAVLSETGPEITAESLVAWIGREVVGSRGATLRQVERQLIETTFERCRGNREQTAKSLGIGIRTLSGKLREYGYPPRGGPGSNRQPIARAA